MSEGDTIHRLASRLGVGLAGHRVNTISVPAPRSPLRRVSARLQALEGERIERVSAHGKHLLVRFGGGLTLHSHLGMNGSWGIARERAKLRRPARQAWVLIDAGQVVVAQFGGSVLELLDEGETRRHPRLSRLGPDLLGDEFDSSVIAERLARLGAERQIGDALLDQRILAGVGNVLKSEGLWQTRLDPFAKTGVFERDQLVGLVEIERRLMEAAVASGRREQHIYRATGRPCPRCGERIRSAPQGDANRTTYWCPGCQG